MAKEYIDKEAFNERLSGLSKRMGQNFNTFTVLSELDNFPVADVRENVKAYWIPFTRFGEWENDGYGVFKPRLLDAGFKCSACKTMKHTKTKWCPDCGAQMTGGAENG